MNTFGLEPLFFLSDLFEHFKTLYLKRDGWIFCCELFESCLHSLIFVKYVYGWVFSGKKNVVWYFVPRKVCGGYVSRGFSQGSQQIFQFV